MKYCRYCSYCILGDWYYCTCHNKVLKRVDNPTSCEDFIESELGDVETGKKYNPRVKYDSNQISLQLEKGGMNYMESVIEKITVERNKKVDSTILGEIQQIAIENGIETKIVLNEKAVADALRKQIPKKPTFVDTRFRNHGRHVGDGCSIDKCYMCPNCRSHIFHVFDSEHYCIHCGQALDWNEKGE